MEGGTRAEPPHGELEGRRREVVEAARGLILRQGLEATTVREISRAAGFSTGVITHHFPDKASVILACFEHISAQWIGDVERTLRDAGDPTERLVAFAEMAVPGDPTRREDWRLWSEMWTYAFENHGFAATLIYWDAAWEGQIADVLAETTAAGLLDVRAPRVQARVLARLIDGLGLRAGLSGDWIAPRATLVDHLRSLGLAKPLAERLLAEGT